MLIVINSLQLCVCMFVECGWATCWWRRRHGHGSHVLPESLQLLLLLLGLSVGQLLAESLVLGPVVPEEGGRLVSTQSGPRPHGPVSRFPIGQLRAHRSYSSAASSTWANSSSNPLPVTADTPTTCRMRQGQPIRSRAVHFYFLMLNWSRVREGTPLN